ncbi:MAG: PEP-CTERM sorting domain-containing protein [Duganella sp.]
MSRLFRPMLAIASIVAALGSTPATAAHSQASALFDYQSFDLVDLNPGDGLDPFISFYDSSAMAQTAFFDAPYGTGAPRHSSYNTATNGSVHFHFNEVGTYLSADLTPTSGQAISDIAHGSSRIVTDAINTFILAPYTQVTFNTYAVVNELNEPGSQSLATFEIIGRLYDADGITFEYVVSLSSDTDRSAQLPLTLVGGAADVYGTLEFRSTVWTQAAPVPEPETISMLLAGAGLIALRLFRSQSTRPIAPL